MTNLVMGRDEVSVLQLGTHYQSKYMENEVKWIDGMNRIFSVENLQIFRQSFGTMRNLKK